MRAASHRGFIYANAWPLKICNPSLAWWSEISCLWRPQQWFCRNASDSPANKKHIRRLRKSRRKSGSFGRKLPDSSSHCRARIFPSGSKGWTSFWAFDAANSDFAGPGPHKDQNNISGKARTRDLVQVLRLHSLSKQRAIQYHAVKLSRNGHIEKQ